MPLGWTLLGGATRTSMRCPARSGPGRGIDFGGSELAASSLSRGCVLQASCSLPSARFGVCHRNGRFLNVIEDIDDHIDV